MVSLRNILGALGVAMSIASIIYAIILSAAADDLAEAEKNLDSKNWQEAAAQLEKVIQGGELNEMGLIVTYWNLFYAYDELNNSDKAGDALLGFLVHSQVYMDEILGHSDNLIVNQFKDRYGLEQRIELAKNTLDTYWMKRVPWICRASLYACVIKSMSSINYFESLIPICDGGIKSRIVLPDSKIEKVVIYTAICQDGKTETYYFYINNEQ